MSGVGIQVRISGAGLSLPARLALETQPERLLPVVGAAATDVVRRHLLGLNRSRPNRLGGPRTEFYRQAANGASWRVVGSAAAVVSITSVGLAQRYHGGTLRPRATKFLTIPVAPEAHGKRAREFGDLEVVFGRGGRPIGLARKPAPGRRGGVMLFRLVKSVTQTGDPTVLPAPAAIEAAAAQAVESAVRRRFP